MIYNTSLNVQIKLNGKLVNMNIDLTICLNLFILLKFDKYLIEYQAMFMHDQKRIKHLLLQREI